MKKFAVLITAAFLAALLAGCTNITAVGKENISEEKTAQPQAAVTPDGSGKARISVPVTLADPEKTIADYFKSIGYDARLVSKDDNVQRGNEKGLVLVFDLGNGASFHATVFRSGGDNGETWEIVDSGFANPGGELLSALIDQKLDEIMSMQQSNESEHNKDAFKGNTLLEIQGYGKPALDYMLEQFAEGKGKGRRGDLMAEACILLLGDTNNVPEGWKSGEEWYSELKPLQIKALPPARRPEGRTLEELAVSAALEHYKAYDKNGVALAAVHVFDSYEDGDMLTIWATVLKHEYLLYDKKLVESSGSVVPAAIKLRKTTDGAYTLAEYIEAKDGSAFAPSIREFCKPKAGVADKILKHYGDYSDLFDKMKQNLINYLKENNLKGIYLEERDGSQTSLT